ncbi:ECF-type sigma factor [Stieleria sp. TO1_6]|uniref:ECF-type sigma factor n=1 Tax=Stieleria tagensis TaxID=2956795 RepID=UPI00209B333D|nr:ECF-type sigma factor [Stieleria tagensis]MCO8123489.1 ECF-type sigma factor [Stieleria tagensis]
MSQQINENESVSAWIAGMKSGDCDAMTALWDRYFANLRDFANKKLGGAKTTVVDSSDVAASALGAIWQGAREGRFKRLSNRDDFWQLLVVIAARKVANIHRKQKTRQERGESGLVNGIAAANLAEMLQSQDDATFNELTLSCDELLAQLDEKHREVALMRLAGYKNQEIADRRDCSVKSVERYLNYIRAVWTQFRLN